MSWTSSEKPAPFEPNGSEEIELAYSTSSRLIGEIREDLIKKNGAG